MTQTQEWSALYQQMHARKPYQLALWLLGLPLHAYLWSRQEPQTEAADAASPNLQIEEQNKQHYFGENKTPEETAKIVAKRLKHTRKNNGGNRTLAEAFGQQMTSRQGLIWAVILAWPMLAMMVIYRLPLVRYIIERLFQMVFVILGVTTIVFTLLYFSPSEPAVNILGVQATPQQIDNFNLLHGLNDSYWIQLARTLKGVATFDFGYTYVGNEFVIDALVRRFPVTLQLTFFSLGIALAIAIPAGIYAAVKANSLFDQFFMFLALIGLSIPTFWLGLIFIFNFAIENRWLPATYNPSNPWSLLMPAVVLGTSLAAAVARMTRGSTLEVIHEDYLLTARSKGLSNWRIIWRHIIPNALIPVVTVIGLQFGGMLGGSAVTEQVFNINGVGSYIVEKQFVPDIPVVLGGVIYIAIIVSIVNLIVDLLYAVLDPRIRTSLKS